MPYEALASHRGRNRCGAGRTTKASPLGDKTTVHIAIISLGIDSRQDKNLMGGGADQDNRLNGRQGLDYCATSTNAVP